MKKTIRFFSMAALALVGAVMTGCSNDDNTIDTPQPENGLVLKTTISLDGGSTTRTLTIDDVNHKGVKTFAKGDLIAVVFHDSKGRNYKAVSTALVEGDITNGGKTATFTVDISGFGATPVAGYAVRYIYPANMAKGTVEDGDLDDAHTIDFTKLNAQTGSLDDLGSNLDLCTFDGTLPADNELPASATLTNRLAILAITLTDNAATPADITSSITDLVVVEGANHYAVTRAAAPGPIYVAIKPTSSAVIEIAATDGANEYGKFLTSKTYAANNGYNVSWKMLPCVNLSTAGYSLNVTEDAVITGTPSKDFISIDCKDDCEVILYNVNSGGTKEVTLDGGDHHLSIKLKGTSKLKYIGCNYGYNLTIDEAETGGTVILENDVSALDGSKVTINGGTVKAKSNDYYAVGCNLEVNGGNVYLAGGYDDYYGGDQRAVSSTITAGPGVTLYGWTGTAWGAATNVRYVTTDNTSGDPTTPSAAWTW